jgi:hypothetical protein
LADDVAAGKRYLSLDPVVLADDRLEQGRFAGAVGADDRDDFTGATEMST